MVRIRLTRTGRKNAPSYRVVAMEKKSKRDGKPLAILGYFNPSKSADDFSINKEKIEEWKQKGAQISDAVQKLLDGTYEYKPYKRTQEVEVEVAEKPNVPQQKETEEGKGENEVAEKKDKQSKEEAK